MGPDAAEGKGWREQKRLETLRRITLTALRLFTANGYEATTLDAIAKAAGISRRTFFYYFSSKEEIVLSWQSAFADAVRAGVVAQTTARSARDAVRGALAALATKFNSDQAIAIDRILRSTEQLRARNLAKYLDVEQAALEALSKHWRERDMREALRMIAMTSVGAFRVAVDAWAHEGYERPLAGHLEEAFASLDLGFAEQLPGGRRRQEATR